jgi:dynein heavy chain 1
MVTETYGGKIDNEGDFEQLRLLVNQFMTPAAFETDHKLVEGVADTEGDGQDGVVDGGLTVPSGTGLQDFMSWINRLPEREPPTYLGLPANAEKLLLVGHGKAMIHNLHHITNLLDEGDQVMAEAAEAT